MASRSVRPVPRHGRCLQPRTWLRSRFIRVVHWGEYHAQEKNPKGAIHEDEGFFGFFELAEAGKPFEVYSRTRLKRVK
jgi:hypothetical protein